MSEFVTFSATCYGLKHGYFSGTCHWNRCLVRLTLDLWLGTAPWFFWIFLMIGIAAGFKNVYIITRREIKNLNVIND
jgi:hypothetical protein